MRLFFIFFLAIVGIHLCNAASGEGSSRKRSRRTFQAPLACSPPRLINPSKKVDKSYLKMNSLSRARATVQTDVRKILYGKQWIRSPTGETNREYVELQKGFRTEARKNQSRLVVGKELSMPSRPTPFKPAEQQRAPSSSTPDQSKATSHKKDNLIIHPFLQ